MKKSINYWFLLLGVLMCITGCKKTEPEYDMVIYGGTSSGIMAAVQASKMGKKVIVIEPGNRIGGLTSGGLGDTDHGKISTIGGLAWDFYERVGKKYGQQEPVWQFEPKVALEVYNDLVKEHQIEVVYNERLDLRNGVIKEGNKIVSVRMESGKMYSGKIFMDTSYEGDLMAKAGISYFVGREGNDMYGETNNGIRPENENELPAGIDPYIKPGDPDSGLLPRVNRDPGGKPGDGDKKIQAYCYRMCLTDSTENRIMIEKPEGYNESDYELLFRALEKGMPKERCFKLHSVRNRKTDSNNHSGISCDYNGGNHAYAEADYETREKIKKAHEIYQKGYVWTVQNHPRIPQEVKDYYGAWGLPKDEFIENNHWTPQLYIRESRRMISDYIVTEHVVKLNEKVADPIGLGSYAIDSHHTQYCLDKDGYVRTEGGFYNPLKQPYPISYKVILPKREECENLLVPICVSATHAAYGSIRMEPVFMILGQSAATAASLCIDNGWAVQELDYALLKEIMVREGQILENPDNESYKVNAFE
jgi:Predicted flavoproteins